MPKLKAAAVSFLNAWPLTEGLKDSSRFELVLAEPSACAAMLERGEVEAALQQGLVVDAARRAALEAPPARAGEPGPLRRAGSRPSAAWTSCRSPPTVPFATIFPA